MKYSGSVSFEFYIERYINKISGEIKTLDKVHPEDEYMFDLEEITLYVEGSSFFSSGRRFGRPEDCSPDEGDTEIKSIKDSFQNDWEDKITTDERKRIIQMIDERVQEQEPDFNEDDEDPPSF